MLPLAVDYVPAAGFRPKPDHLGVIAFELPVTGADLVLPMPQLGDVAMVEAWTSAVAVERGRDGAVGYARNSRVLFGTIAVSEATETEKAAYCAYEEVVRVARAAGYPFLLRVWNHLRGLNEGEGDCERYKRFCAGRHDAMAAASLAGCEFPAASAVGMRSGFLAIYFLASCDPGVQIENPRQVRAYEYPRRYGPRRPSFARATLADGALFVAGTASIVGHESRHTGDIEAQTGETIANLDSVARAAGASLRDLTRLKAYLRRRSDAARVAARLREAVPSAQILLLESDICRRELLVEIEGFAAP